MSAEGCCKIKAIMLITMLAVAQARHVEQNLRFNSGPSPNSGALAQARQVAERMEAMLVDPTFPEQATGFAKQLEARKADPNFNIQADLVAEEMEMLKADPTFQQQAKVVAERMEAMMTNPSLQNQVKLAVEQMDEANSQGLRNRVTEQMEVRMAEVIADPQFQEHAKGVAQQLGAMMTNSNFQQRAYIIAEEMMLAEVTGQPAHMQGTVGQSMGMLADKLSERSLKSGALSRVGLESTTVGKAGRAAIRPTSTSGPRPHSSAALSARSASTALGRPSHIAHGTPSAGLSTPKLNAVQGQTLKASLGRSSSMTTVASRQGQDFGSAQAQAFNPAALTLGLAMSSLFQPEGGLGIAYGASALRTNHYQVASLILGLGTLFAIEGPINNFLRAEKLSGPHLYAGAGIVVAWAMAASLTAWTQNGEESARNAHIAFNSLSLGLFTWQLPTGLDIMLKGIKNTKLS